MNSSAKHRRSPDSFDIAGMFREFESALAGKHPFAAAQLDELATTGTWLVQAITPKGGVRPPAHRPEASAIRDRFWKLVEDRHNDLRTAGVVLFGIRSVDEHVPALLSRSRSARVGEPSKPEPPAASGDPSTPDVQASPGEPDAPDGQTPSSDTMPV